MKNRIIGAAALLSLVIASCGDKDNFHVKGELQNAGEVKKIYLLEADSTRVNVVDSTNLSEDGNFSFKRPSLYANLYKLRIGGSIYDMIAENGDDIKFKADLKDPNHTYTISGSKESEKIQEFNKINSAFSGKLEKISADYQEAAQKAGGESDSLISIYKPQFMALMDEQSKQIIKFVNENKTSLASFYAATSLNPTRYEKELVDYAEAIKDNFKTNQGVQSFVKQMELIKPISVGHKAPDFTMQGLNGKPLKLADYKGKYVLIDFWASWCAPCRAEMPNVVKQYNKFKSKGLEVLGVSLDKEKSPWEASVKTMHMTWPQGSELLEWEGPTSRAYMVQAIPANYLLDPQGNIVAKNLTGTDLEDFLNKTFSKGE